jgi:hypothetical protein
MDRGDVVPHIETDKLAESICKVPFSEQWMPEGGSCRI